MSQPAHHAPARGEVPAAVVTPSAAGKGPVSYAIYRVARGHRNVAAAKLREIGLYAGQELLLMQLWDSGPQRQTELLRMMDIDASTLTRMVQRLESVGLLKRQADPADRRAFLIELTPAGQALRTEVERVWRELEEDTLVDLDAIERAELERLLNKLDARLSDPSIPRRKFEL